jgi:hypothetical protein
MMMRRMLTALSGLALLLGVLQLWPHMLPSSPDRDGDGLDDQFEARLGTDPAKKDTDGDGLEDGWEVFGSVPAFAGPAGNPVPIAIPGANPLRKDIYVEVDWMRDAGHTHAFRRAGRDRVEDAFTRAPVNNPSGEFGVNIHIDVDGTNNARVTLVEYGDFECPYSAEAVTTVQAIQARLGEDLRFVYRRRFVRGHRRGDRRRHSFQIVP